MKKLLLLTLTISCVTAFAQTSEAPTSAPVQNSGPSIDTRALSHPTRPNTPAANAATAGTADHTAVGKDKSTDKKATPASHKTKKHKKKKAKEETTPPSL